MGLTFMSEGYNAATGTLQAFNGLSDQLVREGHPAMVSKSADREPEDQLRIWHDRMTLTPGNRTVYGTVQWQGKKWYRIHPDKVGVPLTSNHEKRRSNDLAYPYNSTSTAAWKRARVLAPKYDITCEGLNFREPWHWTFWGPLGAIVIPTGAITPSPAVPESPKEDDMKLLYVTDSVDGSGTPGWALLNTRTAKVITMRRGDPANQIRANGWARVWGNAARCERQDMLNAIAAIQQTT